MPYIQRHCRQVRKLLRWSFQHAQNGKYIDGDQRSGGKCGMWSPFFVQIECQKFAEYILKRSRDKFARGTTHEKYKGLWDAHPIGTESHTRQLKKKLHSTCEQPWGAALRLLHKSCTNVLIIIHDKMDLANTACPCYACKIWGNTWWEGGVFDFMDGTPQQSILGKVLPPTLYVQLGNCARYNEYRYVFLSLVLACSQRNFQGGVSFFLDGQAYAWRHWCFIYTLQYEVAHRGFSNIFTSSGMIYRFGYCTSHLVFHWRSAQFQGVHQTIHSQRRGPLSWSYQSSTILLLYVWWWYMTMQFNILCTSPNWDLEDGIFFWCQDEHGKCMLLDGEPKPCTPNPMKNGLEIIQGTLWFIGYWKDLCEENITRVVWDTHESLNAY